MTIDVSPLRGFVVLLAIDPMAYALGNRSINAPRLKSLRNRQTRTLARQGFRRFFFLYTGQHILIDFDFAFLLHAVLHRGQIILKDLVLSFRKRALH